MLKICPCCKYVSNLYQTITFTSLLRINTYLANICICPHFSRQRKCNANLELQIYHIFAPFANISKSVFSSSVISCFVESFSKRDGEDVDKYLHRIQLKLFFCCTANCICRRFLITHFLAIEALGKNIRFQITMRYSVGSFPLLVRQLSLMSQRTFAF